MGRALRSAALAAVAASGVQAFAPPANLPTSVRHNAPLRSACSARSVSMQAEPAVSRRAVVSGALAALVLAGSSSPAAADMLKAACTTLSCPDGEGGEYKIEPLVVNQGKFTGKGYQLDRPSDAYFKRVQVFDRVTARPGSVLLRDKKNPDIAIFSNVEQIKNSDFTWKPTIIEAYTKNFGDKFKLVSEDGPVKTGGVDTYTYEYIVETELGSKYEKVHFVSRFSASAENVYIVNAQAKETDWVKPGVGNVLAKCAKSLKVNE